MDYDFTKPGNYPRSGREQVGGVVFLARTIDKMRAFVNGTAGEYNSHRGLSNRVFNLFGVTPEQFEQAVRENPTDEGVLQWLNEHGKLRRWTEKRQAVAEFYLFLAAAPVVPRQLLQRARLRYRWPSRPSVRRLK